MKMNLILSRLDIGIIGTDNMTEAINEIKRIPKIKCDVSNNKSGGVVINLELDSYNVYSLKQCLSNLSLMDKLKLSGTISFLEKLINSLD